MLLWWALGCAAQKKSEAPQAGADVGSGPQREILVWRAERDGVEPSYLMGTCHLQVPLERWLPPPHDRSLDKARVVYTDQELRRRFMSLNEFGRPLLDAAVVIRAERKGVNVRALETVADQLELFGRFVPVFEQALDADSAAAARSESQWDDVVELCSTFDVTRVEASLTEPDPTGFVDALLGERNRGWMVTLRPELERGGVFVAVGAAHLLGADGLLAALGADGYTIERLVGRSDPPQASTTVPAPPPDPPGASDPSSVSHWTAVLSSEVVPSLCTPEGLLRTCFGFDETTCRDEMDRAATLCVAQHGDRLPAPAGVIDLEVRNDVATCMPTGAVFVGIVQGEMGDAPICTMIRTVMDEAMKALMEER